mgnify:CR=1 FL=1
MQNRMSIEVHLEWLYSIEPSKNLKIKSVQKSIQLFWENKLKECKL